MLNVIFQLYLFNRNFKPVYLFIHLINLLLANEKEANLK